MLLRASHARSPENLIPFAIGRGLMVPRWLSVDRQVQQPWCAVAGYLDRRGLLPAVQSGKVRHRPIQSCHLRDADHHASGCRSGRPKSTFTIKQNWTAASENTGGRPGRRALIAIHGMSLSSRVRSDLRRLTALLPSLRQVGAFCNMYRCPLRMRVSGSVPRAVGCRHVSGLCCGHCHAAGPGWCSQSEVSHAIGPREMPNLPNQRRVLAGSLLQTGSSDPVARQLRQTSPWPRPLRRPRNRR